MRKFEEKRNSKITVKLICNKMKMKDVDKKKTILFLRKIVRGKTITKTERMLKIQSEITKRL
jgi:hypothetical protein